MEYPWRTWRPRFLGNCNELAPVADVEPQVDLPRAEPLHQLARDTLVAPLRLALFTPTVMLS